MTSATFCSGCKGFENTVVTVPRCMPLLFVGIYYAIYSSTLFRVLTTFEQVLPSLKQSEFRFLLLSQALI